MGRKVAQDFLGIGTVEVSDGCHPQAVLFVMKRGQKTATTGR